MEEKISVLEWIKMHKKGILLGTLGVAGASLAAFGGYHLGKSCGMNAKLDDILMATIGGKTKWGLGLNEADVTGTIINPVDSSIANYELWTHSNGSTDVAIVNGITAKSAQYVADNMVDIMRTNLLEESTDFNNGNMIIEFAKK